MPHNPLPPQRSCNISVDEIEDDDAERVEGDNLGKQGFAGFVPVVDPFVPDAQSSIQAR
jgi:hypothetical protein